MNYSKMPLHILCRKTPFLDLFFLDSSVGSYTLRECSSSVKQSVSSVVFFRCFLIHSRQKGKVWRVAHQVGAYPGFWSMKRLSVFLLPPGWDASPLHGYPSIRFAGTHLYTRVERGTVRGKSLAQEDNTMSPTRTRARTARALVEFTNHEASAPPISPRNLKFGL